MIDTKDSRFEFVEKKELDYIAPLNGYRLDCYRQALLPAIIHFKRDIRPLLLANVGYFEFRKTLSFLELPLLNNEFSLQCLGIKQEYLYIINNDFIENVCKSIDENKIVIAYVDTYSYNRFPALCSNVHSRHGVLIYGYDLKNQFFNIIDSDFVENFERKKSIISFQDLVIAHAEMVDYYQIPDYIELIDSFEDYNTNYPDMYISEYISFIKNNSEIFRKSTESLSNYAHYFNSILYKKEQAMRTAYPIYMSFNKAINLRHLEYVSYSKIFKNIEEILSCLDDLIDCYNYVRAVMYKTLYAQQYREQSFLKCYDIITNIIELEKKLYKLQCKNMSIDNII